MKKAAIITSLLLLAGAASFSQGNEPTNKDHEIKTLLGPDSHHGFYGAFTAGYSEIESKQAIIFGGRFEWLTGHSVGIGFGGTGFINENHYEPLLNTDVFLTGGYGGLYIEPIVMPDYPVHLSFPVLLGCGGISYVTEHNEYNHNVIEDSRAFLIAEPGAEIELNLTRNFRLSIGASYRFTTPFDIGTSSSAIVNSSSLRGFSYNMTFKFGRF